MRSNRFASVLSICASAITFSLGQAVGCIVAACSLVTYGVITLWNHAMELATTHRMPRVDQTPSARQGLTARERHDIRTRPLEQRIVKQTGWICPSNA